MDGIEVLYRTPSTSATASLKHHESAQERILPNRQAQLKTSDQFPTLGRSVLTAGVGQILQLLTKNKSGKKEVDPRIRDPFPD